MSQKKLKFGIFSQEKEILENLKTYEYKAYPENFVQEEKETIDFTYTE